MKKWSSLLVVVLTVGFLPIEGAWAAPRIEFLNPSGYTTNIVISNKPDSDGSVHLVAWVGEVPSNPLVEFEITSATLGTTTIDATRSSNDTWEAFLDVSSMTDGQYAFVARLYANFTGPGTGQEVDSTDPRPVTLNRSDVPPPPAANTVEMTYPTNGGAFGIHKPRSGLPNGVIDTVVSEGTDQVRVLFTTSDPGAPPEWISCGSGRVSEGRARARCTLTEGVAPADVTAVAAVANDTPAPAEPNPVADATGDAHRVAPYDQLATAVDVTPESITAEPGTCSAFTATVTDQTGRTIAGANVDVHAVGPDDQVRFGNIQNTTSAFQAPDKGHVAGNRPAIDCADKTNEGMQGDHNIPGANDPQHIESVSGSNNSGQFIFALYSTSVGGTRIDVWSERDDDDVQQGPEASGGGRVGWGQPPPPASRDIFLDPVTSTAETGSCKRVEMIGKLSGNPMVGQNVDVHISGPNESVNFCMPPDGSSGTDPDSGTHTGNSDDATTRHLEGVLDGNGRFIFGVTSSAEGSTSVIAWADVFDDDLRGTDEASKTGDIGWTASGERSISIQSTKSTARKGSRVRFSGRIEGSPVCESSQTVKLKTKRLNRGTFRTIGTTTTAADGSYTFSVVVRISKKYRTVAPVAGACEKAISRVITVRAN